MDIRALRLSKNISQKQLADLTGLSQQHISKIEKNLIAPTYSTLEKIVRALGYELIFRKENDDDRNTN